MEDPTKRPTITVIRVKYAVNNSREDPRNPEGVKNNEDDRDSGPTIPDGNTKEVIVNLDCPIGLILDYIREIACLKKAGEIDLCEEGTNNMKNLESFPCWTRGTDILAPDVNYFIVKVDRDSEGQICGIVPVLNGKKGDAAASDIMSKIRGPPAVRNRAASSTSGKSGSLHGKALPGRNVQEKRSRVGKPASKDP